MCETAQLERAFIFHSRTRGLGLGPKGPPPSIPGHCFGVCLHLPFCLIPLSSCLTSLHHLTLPCGSSPRRGKQGRHSRHACLRGGAGKIVRSHASRRDLRPPLTLGCVLCKKIAFYIDIPFALTCRGCIKVRKGGEYLEKLYRNVSPSCTELSHPYLSLCPCPTLPASLLSPPLLFCCWFYEAQKCWVLSSWRSHVMSRPCGDLAVLKQCMCVL